MKIVNVNVNVVKENIVIKLKSLIVEQEEKQKIHKLVSNWKNKKAQEYASVLIEKYGDVIGEVIHHTLFEDGTITKYDVKFGNRIVKNIPTAMLEVVKMQEHKHEADDGDDEENDD